MLPETQSFALLTLLQLFITVPPGKLCMSTEFLLKAYYWSTHTEIHAYGQESFFDIHSGVQQGCVLSLMLFSYVIDWITSCTLSQFHGVTIGSNFTMTNLDILIVAFIASEKLSVILKEGHTLDKVNCFKYLSLMITATSQEQEVIDAHIDAAHVVFCRFRIQIWCRSRS